MSRSRSCQLPMSLPEHEDLRLVLRIIRRMAAHGLRDGEAVMLAVGGFGSGFRRPLVLLRAFVAELAQCSQRRITVAPSCALRMTRDEARLLGIVATAGHNPADARDGLRALADRHDVDHPLSAAIAIASAMHDLGRPLPRLAPADQPTA